MTTDSRVDVCIQGAGPVGACLALALSRRGFSVALRSVALRAAPARGHPAGGDVRAYALNTASVALLRDLRVWEALPANARTPVYDMRVAGDQGGRIEFSAWQQCVEQLAWIVDAEALDQVLAQALQYAPHVTRVTDAQATVPAGLLAICEGRHSGARAQRGVRMRQHAYDHQAVAARLVSDRPHDGVAWQWFQSPGVLGLLPFDRPQAGCSFALVWSQRTDEAQRWLAAEPAEFEAALNAATGGAAGQLRLASARSAWPLVTAQADTVCGEGWVLLGDAAHAMHPLAGQGLNLGLGDVAALAQTLAQARARTPWRSPGDARVLRQYARSRAMATWAMSTMVDGLWQLFARPEAPLAQLRNRGLSLVDHAGGLKRWLAARALGG